MVALRAARAAAGWSQEEFAQLMGVAKTTVARIETLEMSARALDAEFADCEFSYSCVAKMH